MFAVLIFQLQSVFVMTRILFPFTVFALLTDWENQIFSDTSDFLTDSESLLHLPASGSRLPEPNHENDVDDYNMDAYC